MAALGFKNYRFSVSWPRVIPSGDGPVNAKGLQFYSDLVDELIKHKIEPFVYGHTHIHIRRRAFPRLRMDTGP
jgi:beta-glucosidase/6-phospho-beta-glucosidase/beta-galactosidase